MDEQEFCVSPQADKAFAAIERYLHPHPLLIVISGPSGVGKDSVIKCMRERDYPFHFVVTTTDRAPRPDEIHGVDYYFISTAEFERMIVDDDLFESARVYGQYKGVPKVHARQALSSGMDVIMRLDVQGAATIRRRVPQVLTIFLAPPSLDVLIDRLRRRAGDSTRQVQKRLKMALGEMRRIKEFEYVVVNQEGRLDETVKQIMAIIAAEKCRTVGRKVTF